MSAYAFVVVGLRWLIPVAWIVAVVLAWLALPALDSSGRSPLDDIVPKQSATIDAQTRALELFGSAIATDTVVVQRNPGGLGIEELRSNALGARDVAARRVPPELAGIRAAVPLVNHPLGDVRWNERDTTALTYLFLADDFNLVERDAAVKAYAGRYLRPAEGTTVGTTGGGAARLTQFEVMENALPWIEGATVAVILVIVSLYFRSIGAPLVTLFTVAIAYIVAIRVLAWTGDVADVAVPAEIEPVLVVLLLGLVTDYTIFFLSEARRRLERGESRLPAARHATARIVPIVFTAGVLVAAGSASLLAGELEFFRVFGPGLAVCALVVTLVCITLVPAIIALAGPWLFGRRVREASRRAPAAAPPAVPARAAHATPGRGARLFHKLSGLTGALRASRRHAHEEGRHFLPLLGARVLAMRPVSIVLAIVCAGVLLVAATGARSSDLEVAFVQSLPTDSEPRRAADAAGQGFVPGILSPTDVILEQPGIASEEAALVALQERIEEEPGIRMVLGPREQVGSFGRDLTIAEDGTAARFAVILEGEPTGADGIQHFRDLRDRMPALAREAGFSEVPRFMFAGETPLSAETVDAIIGDLRRIAVAVLVLTFVVLALYLRALVAPLLLLIASTLAFAGAYGLTALLLPHVIGGDDFVYYVPLVGAVLLVALGSDYNVFIAGRIREEAQKRRLREAIAVAAPSASRAITVAGITLASTFALLALIDLVPFQQLALLMAVGVLVDALLVRPLLIPALLSVAGPRAWWPGQPARPPKTEAFLLSVALQTEQPLSDARRMTEATLGTLAERLSAPQARELAPHLPPSLMRAFERAPERAETFGFDEFVERVARRTGTSPDGARNDVAAVFATLRETLPATELEYVHAALSRDYEVVFDGHAGHAGHAARGEPAVPR